MKAKSILVTLTLFLLVSLSAISQSDVKVIAVVNHAEWCPTCQHHGERAQEAFKEGNTDGAIQFVVNNLTNDDTRAQSAQALKDVGLDKAMTKHKGTGVVYLFDAKNKTFIDKVSVAKSNEEIKQALATAKNKAK
ncbi:hypothetical protein ACT29H_11495 [Thermophagus sp. OGC60D27]|uniref:hypothetical protein n=1 Tax=Thermophagus sp. OGC60D27 TaxID=3458415 RepID=UPI004037D38A